MLDGALNGVRFCVPFHFTLRVRGSQYVSEMAAQI
jgi:hypothetical protein